jgi:Domain of unknown function DUF1828
VPSRVFTPFMLEDGDHLAIVLRKESEAWTLSDEGHTYMHPTYDLDEKHHGGATGATARAELNRPGFPRASGLRMHKLLSPAAHLGLTPPAPIY